jgi:hypothetical protein
MHFKAKIHAHRNVHRAQKGFGLLEALVALVLFAGVGIVCIAWLQQSLSTATRLSTSLNDSNVRLAMLAKIKSINLAENPAGQDRIDDYAFQWKSEFISENEPQIGYPAGVGRHTISLLKVKMSATPENGTLPAIQEEVVMVAHRPSLVVVAPTF